MIIVDMITHCISMVIFYKRYRQVESSDERESAKYINRCEC
ncbi:hypothetical protein [Campylobacter jejuni]|nr:hypothetical protein [Campylobacter jejuni]